MTGFLPLFFQVAWGAAVGGAFGGYRTLLASRHLLEKNKALTAAGIPPLPGSGHWETLAGSAPAWAGALFFALSLGIGYAALCHFWGRLLRRLPPETLGIGAAVLLILPLMAQVHGEWDTCLALLLIGAGGVLTAFSAEPLRPAAVLALAASLLLAGAGFSTWYAAEEGGFTRLRDKYLLRTQAGLALNDFYYRWTLYPAEVIKPLAARTQPTVELPPVGNAEILLKFRADAARFHYLPLPRGDAGADVTSRLEGGKILFEANGRAEEWPPDAEGQARAAERLSADADGARVLRRATLVSLLAGAPLVLLGLCAAAFDAAGRAVAPGARRNTLILLLAACTGALLAAAGSPAAEHGLWRSLSSGTASREETAAALASPDPATRYYGVMGTQRDPSGHRDALLAALKDPVLNVRYTAALGLSDVRDEAARKALLDVLEGEGEWYLKDRAYISLWRGGWRPW